MPASEATLAAYQYRIERVRRLTGLTDLTNAAPIIAIIQAMTVGDSTKKGYLVALHNNTKLDAYREAFKTLSVAINEVVVLQEKTEKEKARWLDWPDIAAAGLKALNDKCLPIGERLLMGLYTQTPPARSDYTNVLVTSKPTTQTTGCVVDLSANTCTIYSHKTTKSVGAIVHPLPPSLVAVLRDFLGDLESRVLFEGLSPSAQGRRLKRAFQRHTGKDLNINLLRHSYITEQNKGHPFLLEKTEAAQAMGHSVAMDELYRRR
jgi:integrase